MRKSAIVKIDGKEGIFRTEKEVLLFWQHLSQSELKDSIATIVKESRKLTKNDRVMIDILESQNNNRKDKFSYIINARWNNIELDVRRFNGHDYSDSTKYTFLSTHDLFRYLKKEMTRIIEHIIGNLPEDDTFYGMKIGDRLNVDAPEYALLND